MTYELGTEWMSILGNGNMQTRDITAIILVSQQKQSILYRLSISNKVEELRAQARSAAADAQAR
jgi:hypothetical protein